jgi:hypothetical protein
MMFQTIWLIPTNLWVVTGSRNKDKARVGEYHHFLVNKAILDLVLLPSPEMRQDFNRIWAVKEEWTHCYHLLPLMVTWKTSNTLTSNPWWTTSFSLELVFPSNLGQLQSKISVKGDALDHNPRQEINYSLPKIYNRLLISLIRRLNKIWIKKPTCQSLWRIPTRKDSTKKE